jgi:hypothetical protein
MEDKRLTANRYPLHFEVWTRCPIGVGKRKGRLAVKPNIQKPSVGAEGFCFFTSSELPSNSLKSLIAKETLLGSDSLPMQRKS